MKSFKKLSVGFMATCLIIMASSTSFASDCTSLPDNSYAKIKQMSRGDNTRKVTIAPATNIASDKPTGRIDISRGDNTRKITSVPATNISD